MKTEKGSGTSIEKRDEGKCEREGDESQQPERRSTGIEIPERNSSRFPLLVAVSTRVVSSSSLSPPLNRILNPVLDLGLASVPRPLFHHLFRISIVSPFAERDGPTANRSPDSSLRPGLIHSTLRKRNLALESFQPQKTPRFISLSGATRHWAVDRGAVALKFICPRRDFEDEVTGNLFFFNLPKGSIQTYIYIKSFKI